MTSECVCVCVCSSEMGTEGSSECVSSFVCGSNGRWGALSRIQRENNHPWKRKQGCLMRAHRETPDHNTSQMDAPDESLICSSNLNLLRSELSFILMQEKYMLGNTFPQKSEQWQRALSSSAIFKETRLPAVFSMTPTYIWRLAQQQ